MSNGTDFAVNQNVVSIAKKINGVNVAVPFLQAISNTTPLNCSKIQTYSSPTYARSVLIMLKYWPPPFIDASTGHFNL